MFNRMQSLQMQGVHCFQYKSFRAVIAIHNTFLGPALGGCRCLHYSNENLAFDDAMRLARGMSYKAALANVPHGGGKAVILLPKEDFDRNELFHWFGDCVELLKGQYITAMDAGTQVGDMDRIAERTDYVASASNIGDPAPYTAAGVFKGIEAALQFRLQQELLNSSVAVQGLGHVGLKLVEMLINAGAKVIAADPDTVKCQQANKLGADIVSTEQIVAQPVDVFSPCALGGAINADTLPLLNCTVIAGSANNQLASDDMGSALFEKGILYAPDYVINSGGLIYAASRYHHDEETLYLNKINSIGDTLIQLFEVADKEQQAVEKIADKTAQTILAGEPLIANKANARAASTTSEQEVHHAA